MSVLGLLRKPLVLFTWCEVVLHLSTVHGCTLENPQPDPIHGRVIYEEETYKCWYTGPTHVSCTGDCGVVAPVSTVSDPLDPDSLHSVCSCCGSNLIHVTETIFRCDFIDESGEFMELTETLEFNGTYYSFEDCQCSSVNNAMRLANGTRPTVSPQGRFCQLLNNTKFENQCQAQSGEGVTVCYSFTRWAVPDDKLALVSAVMKTKMLVEESGIYRLPESIELIAEPYRPSNPFKFPAEIFKPSECDTSGSSVVTTTQRTALLFFTCIVTLFLLL